MRDLYAKCGVNCGRCPSFRENLQNEEDRRRCSDGWAKYLGFRLSPAKLLRCDGCQAPDDENPVRYQNCHVRRCAVRTGVGTCAHCSAYPCEEVPTVSLSAGARERIAARVGTSITDKDYLTFIEPYEGTEHLDHIRASLAPADVVDKAEVRPIRARIVDFPQDLRFSAQEASALRAVHGLLEHVRSAPAETYARQLLSQRRRPHMLGLLWVVGLYGELEQNDGWQLVLDGTTYGSRKECAWLVRKRDNSLYGAARQAATLLEDCSVRWEFVPSEEGWLLKLSLGEEAAGEAAVRALKQYAVRLAEQHGEPVYVGSCRLKGEAFSLFSKADMRILSSGQSA